MNNFPQYVEAKLNEKLRRRTTNKTKKATTKFFIARLPHGLVEGKDEL